MKKIPLTLFIILLFTVAKGQGFEWSVQANAGLYGYTGNGSTASTFFNANSSAGGYANNPYGSTMAFSYGAGFAGQWVTKGGFMIGLNASFDVLRSRENITTPNQLFFLNLGPAEFVGLSGYSILTTEDINANPFVGYRFKARQVKIDVMAGLDLAFSVNNYENGDVKDTNGNRFNDNNFFHTLPADTRIRIGTAVWYRKFGITASYAAGLTNLTANVLSDSTPPVTKSELIRLGLTYRLK